MLDELKTRFNWMVRGKIKLKTPVAEVTLWKRHAFVLKALVTPSGCAFYRNLSVAHYPATTLEVNGKTIGLVFGKAFAEISLSQLARLVQQQAWTPEAVYLVIYQNVAYRSTHPTGQALLNAIAAKTDPDIAPLLSC